MSRTLFISDLHLAESRPSTTAAFLSFLDGPARDAETLWILGDLYEYWTADGDLDEAFNGAVADALASGKVAVLVGDWTNGDAALGRFIERHNRAGVPLYLWCKPGEAEPRVLPQILSQGMLTDLAAGK